MTAIATPANVLPTVTSAVVDYYRNAVETG